MFTRAISSVETIKPRWKRAVHELPEKIDEAGMRAENSNLGQSLTKWLTVVTNEKLREWIQNHPPAQVPSSNNSERLKWVLTNRELWIIVHDCAKKKNVDNLCYESSQPTVEYHAYGSQDSNKRWNEDESSSVHRETVAFTMRVTPGLLEKQQRRQRQQQQQSCVNTSEDKVQLHGKKSVFQRTEFGLWFLDDIRGEDFTRHSHLQMCLLRHHDRRPSDEAMAKLIGKRIHVWWLVALLLPQKLQICKFGDIRAIRRP